MDTNSRAHHVGKIVTFDLNLTEIQKKSHCRSPESANPVSRIGDPVTQMESPVSHMREFSGKDNFRDVDRQKICTSVCILLPWS